MTHLTDSTSRIQERSYSIILETFERRLRLGELRVGDKPVSYTHLTLPTICSV